MNASQTYVPRLSRKRKRRRGSSAVEFAMVAPIFLVLVFGILEFGRLVMVQQIVTNAAREGARAAVLDGATNQEVQDAVSEYLEASSVSSETVTVSPDPLNSAASGDPVSVTIDLPFSAVSWLPAPWFLDGKTLNSTVVMRRESTSAN